MRSRIRFLTLVIVVALLASSYLLIGATSRVQAAVMPISTNNGSPAYLTSISGKTIGGAQVIGDLNMYNSAIALFDATPTVGTACGNIGVYRVTVAGDLLLQPEMCVGDQMNVIGLGGNFLTDYILVAFSSPGAVNTAPQLVAHGSW